MAWTGLVCSWTLVFMAPRNLSTATLCGLAGWLWFLEYLVMSPWWVFNVAVQPLIQHLQYTRSAFLFFTLNLYPSYTKFSPPWEFGMYSMSTCTFAMMQCAKLRGMCPYIQNNVYWMQFNLSFVITCWTWIHDVIKMLWFLKYLVTTIIHLNM